MRTRYESGQEHAESSAREWRSLVVHLLFMQGVTEGKILEFDAPTQTDLNAAADLIRFPPLADRRGSARGMAQSGSASALGAEGRGFESLCPDQFRGGPNWSDGSHFLPETWVTVWPRRGLGPGSTRDMADANPRTAGVPRRYVLWWTVGYNARPRTRCARIPGIDLIIRLARGLFDHRARSSTG